LVLFIAASKYLPLFCPANHQPDTGQGGVMMALFLPRLATEWMLAGGRCDDGLVCARGQ
jgi:hypothetical protein